MRSAVALLLAVVLLLGGCDDGATTTTDPTGGTTGGVPTGSAPTPGAATTTLPDDDDVASTASIPTDELPVVRFTAAGGAAAELPVEVPPREEYSIGLSGRRSLEGRGMLFYYGGESGGPGFWMRGTYIDLDIAFVAGDGTIISIETMEAGTEDIHHPGRAYLAGIEAPPGWYAQHGIRPGDRYEFLFDPQALLGSG